MQKTGRKNSLEFKLHHFTHVKVAKFLTTTTPYFEMRIPGDLFSKLALNYQINRFH